MANFEENDTIPTNCQVQLNTEKTVEEKLGTIFTGLAGQLDCLERGWIAMQSYK
jgi:hypothetical protein